MNQPLDTRRRGARPGHTASHGRCPAAAAKDPTPCEGPRDAATIVDRHGREAAGCVHHCARLLAGLEGARVHPFVPAPQAWTSTPGPANSRPSPGRSADSAGVCRLGRFRPRNPGRHVGQVLRLGAPYPHGHGAPIRVPGHDAVIDDARPGPAPSALDDVDSQPAPRRLLVLDAHVGAGVLHGLDDLVEDTWWRPSPRRAMRAAVTALTAAMPLRSMHGIWTRPPTGSQVRPRLCSMPISAAFSTCSGIRRGPRRGRRRPSSRPSRPRPGSRPRRRRWRRSP